MTSSNTQFVGSIPEIYDAHLGPLMFEFSAADLAARVAQAVPEGGRVLEVACGTGISTEYLRRALPPSVEIVATDLNEAMVAFAAAKRGALAKVAFRPADALALPFDDGDFDAVVCQFGVMFFPDKAKGLAEMTRVLKPGGVLAFKLWDSLEHNRIVEVVLDVTARFFDRDPPTFYRLPYGYGEIDPIKTLLQQVGFRDLDIHVVRALVERPDARHLARGFVEGTPVILEIRERATAESAAIIEAVAAAFEADFGPAPLKIPLQEIVFTARKPQAI